PIEFTWMDKSFRVSYSTDVSIIKSHNRVKVDMDLVSLPIEVRSWRQGDVFIPLGLKGRKKVSDFLIDQKISLDEKDGVPLFVKSNEDILWNGLHRIDDRYRISKKTKKVIIFEQL